MGEVLACSAGVGVVLACAIVVLADGAGPAGSWLACLWLPNGVQVVLGSPMLRSLTAKACERLLVRPLSLCACLL